MPGAPALSSSLHCRVDQATPNSSTACGSSCRLSKAVSSSSGILTRRLAMKPWSWPTLVIGMIPGMIGTVTQHAESRALLGTHLRLYQVHSATLDSGVLENGFLHEALARERDLGLGLGITTSGPSQADT